MNVVTKREGFLYQFPQPQVVDRDFELGNNNNETGML
jgi:hypothetical protein